MRGNGGIGHAQKALGNDSSDFKAIKTLRLHFRENSLHRILDSGRSKSAKEHHLYFCRHEEEIPARSMDLAIKRETIQPTDYTPFSRAGLTLQPEELPNQRALFDQNGSDIYGWRHKSFQEVPSRWNKRSGQEQYH